MNKFKVSISVYQCNCHVIIDDEIEKTINKYVKKHKWDKTWVIADNEQVHGYALSPGNLKDYYIFYSLHSLTPNFIAHEISHTIDDILEERQIELVGESRSYLTGYLTEKIFDYIIKNKMLISKWLPFIQKEENLVKTKTVIPEVPASNQL